MSKSVLVIDTPKSCENCYMLSHNYCNFQCLITGELIEKSTNKPDWCPLKPLPEKMKVTGLYNGEYFKAGGKLPSYKIGWNDCIDEITGGMD